LEFLQCNMQVSKLEEIFLPIKDPKQKIVLLNYWIRLLRSAKLFEGALSCAKESFITAYNALENKLNEDVPRLYFQALDLLDLTLYKTEYLIIKSQGNYTDKTLDEHLNDSKILLNYCKFSRYYPCFLARYTLIENLKLDDCQLKVQKLDTAIFELQQESESNNCALSLSKFEKSYLKKHKNKISLTEFDDCWKLFHERMQSKSLTVIHINLLLETSCMARVSRLTGEYQTTYAHRIIQMIYEIRWEIISMIIRHGQSYGFCVYALEAIVNFFIERNLPNLTSQIQSLQLPRFLQDYILSSTFKYFTNKT